LKGGAQFKPACRRRLHGIIVINFGLSTLNAGAIMAAVICVCFESNSADKRERTMRILIKMATGGVVMAAMAALASGAYAKNDKPINAAMPDSGEGCLVSNVGGGDLADYMADPTCKFHIVRKNDKDGNPRSIEYQDKGQLQEGQTPPDKAVHTSWEDGDCSFSETITPNGGYSSNAHCKF
jgi:hypothetical protein